MVKPAQSRVMSFAPKVKQVPEELRFMIMVVSLVIVPQPALLYVVKLVTL